MKTERRIGVEVRDCGLAKYREILALQHRLQQERREGLIGDAALIVEHLPVITLGARDSANKLLLSRAELAAKGIDVVEIRRGGGTTAHNPGQVVFYPILSLREWGLGENEYVRQLEAIGVEVLEGLGVAARPRKGFPGRWVDERKIASIGVRVSKGVSYHGMAINICNDLRIFEYIVPCGLEGVEMTSVMRETGREHTMQRVKARLADLLVRYFSVEGRAR